MVDFEGETLTPPRWAVGTPSGLASAAVNIGAIPEGMSVSGDGAVVESQPGQGGLLIRTLPVKVDGGLIMVRVEAMASRPGAEIAVAALNSPLDGQMAYFTAASVDLPIGSYRTLMLIYDPPSDKIQLALQAVVPRGATKPVTVYFDNIEVVPLPSFQRIPVAMDVDGTFDQDVSQVIINPMGTTGSVTFVPRSVSNNAYQLTLFPRDEAANLGVFATSLQDSFPHILLASVDARLAFGQGGTTALVVTNGYGTVGLFTANNDLPTDSSSWKRLIVGGQFIRPNPTFPLLTVVQNGGPGVASSTMIDNLTIEKAR